MAAVPLLFRAGRDAARRGGSALPWSPASSITGGVMAYGYLANRYTSEFVPALVFGAAVGDGALVSQWLGAAAPAVRGRRSCR